MVAFLRWVRGIGLGVLNGVARFAAFVILLFLVFMVIGLIRGDGLPSNMVLALDLRHTDLQDSSHSIHARPRPVTVMDIVLGARRRGTRQRVKGVVAARRQRQSLHRAGRGDRRRAQEIPQIGQIRHRAQPGLSTPPVSATT